jgi:hypothetical protein
VRTTHDAEKLVRQKWRLLKATMDERQRRLWAGTEAGAFGFGGVVAVARATGLAISTVRKGSDEARAGAKPQDVVNVRRSTGERPFEELRPEVWPALEKLVDPVTRGDPESPLRRTCKSTRVLADELSSSAVRAISSKSGGWPTWPTPVPRPRSGLAAGSLHLPHCAWADRPEGAELPNPSYSAAYPGVLCQRAGL